MKNDIERLLTLLLLVEFHDYKILRLVVKGWTKRDRELASRWAIREHLIANDNDLKRLKKPKCIYELIIAIAEVKSTNCIGQKYE